jgi:hypothetical protein
MSEEIELPDRIKLPLSGRIRLPFRPPAWEIDGVEWSFWSFVLQPGQSTGGTFFGEVIFGVPFILLVRPGSPFPNPLEPVTTLTSPLTNANIVGVSAGSGGGFECTGTEILLTSHSFPVVWEPGLSTYGTTNVTVNNGVATLNDLGAEFSYSSASRPGANMQFYLSKNGNAQVFYSASYQCTGTWTFRNSWAAWVPFQPASFGLYSIANPPESIPAFPPGGVFSQ